MGCVFSIVFPDGRRFYHQAGNIQFPNGGQIRVRRVLNENIVGKIGNTGPESQLVAQADNASGVLITPLFRNVISVPKPFHQQRSGNVRVPVPIGKIGLEIVLLGGGILFQRIFKGSALGYWEGFDVFNLQFLAQLYQLQQGLIGVLGTGDNIVVENQVITGPVADQRIAVPVQNITPGSLHPGIGGIGGSIVGLALCLNDLQVIEFERKNSNDQAEDQQ